MVSVLSLVIASSPQQLVISTSVVTSPEVYDAPSDVELAFSAQRAARFAVGIELSPANERKAEIDSQVRACEGDLACEAKAIESLGGTLGLIVVLNLEVSPHLLAVSLIETQSQQQIGFELFELQDARAAEVRVEREVETMLAASGHPVGGRVLLTLAPADATLSIQTSTTTRVSATTGALRSFLLPNGEHVLLADREGYEPSSTTVVVQQRQETAAEITLEEQSEITDSPWLWAGVAGGVIGAGALVMLALSGSDCICIGPEDCQGCP